MKKNVLYFGIMTASQLDSISDYVIRYLGDKGNNKISI